MKNFIFLILSSGLVFIPLKALPSTNDSPEYEELSYEDLVEQISRKKQKVIRTNTADPLDDIKLHAGLGLITAVNSMKIEERNFARTMNGFEISLGIDLFSQYWTSEAVLRNFGTSGSGSETRSLREFDLRVVHRNPLGDKLGYRVGSGLGTRYFKYSDSQKGLSLSEEVPCVLAFGGLETYSNQNLSIGAEMGLRVPLVDSSSDKTSLDMMVRLDTTF
jgi:hypothetical protein